MFIVNEMNAESIIETIESVENTLLYSTMAAFKDAMVSIGFKVRKLKNYQNFSSYSCKGSLGEYEIHLDVYQATNDSEVYIEQKRYYDKNTVTVKKRIIHRSNNLPASICYTENGLLWRFGYYYNGVEYRENNKPLYITYEYNDLKEIVATYHRYFPAYQYEQVDLSLYHITFSNSEIIDATFCHKSELITFQAIQIICPDVKMKTLNDLLNLKKTLNSKELKLIEMFYV